MPGTHLGLTDSTLVTSCISLRSLTGTAVNSAAFDMQGWSGIQFVIPAGIFGTNGTLDGLVQTDDNSGFNSPTNITNSNLTQLPAANANSVAVIDIWRPSERYVRLQLTGQTNGVTAGAVAVQYGRTGILPPTAAAQQVVKVASN